MKKPKILLTLVFLMMLVAIISPLVTTQSYAAGPYPLKSATVNANQTNGPSSESNQTDDSGHYMINKGLAVGNYTIDASSDGFLPSTKNTTIASLSDVKTIDFNLNRSRIIKGRVIDNESRPVIGAEVTLYSTTSGYITSTKTDSNGKYYFATDVDTGTYYLKADYVFNFSFSVLSIRYGGNYTVLPLSYIDAPYLQHGYVAGQSANFAATAGAITSAPDFIVNGSGVITGTVRDQATNPVPYAAVSAVDTSTFASFGALTDANGVYRISYDILSGNYSLTAYHFGLVGTTKYVTTTQGSTVNKDLTLVQTAKVQGHVLRSGDNKPISDALIEFTDASTLTYQTASTDANGFYEIKTGLGPGNYSVIVNIGGSFLPSNQTTVLLSAGQNLTLDFTVPAFFISGTVYENSTQSGVTVPYPSVEVSFGSFFPPGGSTTGNANGTYLLTVPIAQGTQGQSYTGTFTVSGFDYNTTTVTHSLTIGTDVTGINFALFKTSIIPPSQSATIQGSVTGNAGPDLPFSYQKWYVPTGNTLFPIILNASSEVINAYASTSLGMLTLSIWGPDGTQGTMTIWIPKSAIPGPFTITSLPGPDPTIVSQTQDATNFIITIQYNHSAHILTFQNGVIPEYSEPLLLITMMTLTAAAVLMLKKSRQIQMTRLNNP